MLLNENNIKTIFANNKKYAQSLSWSGPDQNWLKARQSLNVSNLCSVEDAC